MKKRMYVLGQPRPCNRCSKVLPWTSEHFHRHGDNRLHGNCKPCQIALVTAAQRRMREEKSVTRRRALIVFAQVQQLVADNCSPYKILEFITQHWGHAA